jgi:hypothetical protein
MIFAGLVAGEAIFLDANTLVYHFVSDLAVLSGLLSGNFHLARLPSPC